MSQIHVVQDGLVNAPPVDVYRFISDYQHHHPNFLPPAFSDFEVVRGGIGAGTEISFQLKLGMQVQHFHGLVDEPVPGYVLTETYPELKSMTTFTVEPSGNVSRVTIETTWTSGGIRGMVERAVAPRLMRQLFADELVRLDRYARERLALV